MYSLDLLPSLVAESFDNQELESVVDEAVLKEKC